MTGYIGNNTQPVCAPAPKIRLFCVDGASQTWAVWRSDVSSDDIVGFVSSENELHWSARGAGDEYGKPVNGFTTRKAAAVYLILAGGIRVKPAAVIESDALAGVQ